MFNAKQMLDQLVQTVQGTTGANTFSSQPQGGIGRALSNPAITGALSGVGGGLLAGMLFGNRNVRQIGGNVAAVGGAAVLGTLAYKAYQNWQAKKGASSGASEQGTQPSPQGQPSPQVSLNFDNLPAAKQEDHSRAMLTAIIAAAKADGVFDARERQIIHEQTAKIDDPETTAWVQQEINKPLDVSQVAALATSPELAAEMFLATLFVIDEQNEREKVYLNALATKMGIDPQLRQEIEKQLVQSECL